MGSKLDPEDFKGRVPSASQYESALTSLLAGLRPHEMKMLRVHYDAPDATVTATEMACAMGYASYAAANLQYGKLGRKLAALLGLNMRHQVNVLTDFDQRGKGPNAEWHWIMWPSLRDALERMGWM